MLKKWGFFAIMVGGVALSLFFATQPSQFSPGAKNNDLKLIVEPDQGIGPLLSLIAAAHTSVDLVIYQLDDDRFEDALVAAARRGVTVRVIMSAGYDGGLSTVNKAAFERLHAAGVPVRWSPAYFSLTHEKSFVVDGERAVIMTFNLVAKYYPTGRDFGILDQDERDIEAMQATFDDDWNGRGFWAGGNGNARGDDLLWSPGSEHALLAIIENARRSLAVYNEEMADPEITRALIDAAERGVEVRIVMTNSGQWKWEFAALVTAGALVRTYADDNSAPLYIHAKAIIADGARAFVGSENFSKASLEKNRELGIVTQDHAVVADLLGIFGRDWKGAVPFQL